MNAQMYKVGQPIDAGALIVRGPSHARLPLACSLSGIDFSMLAIASIAVDRFIPSSSHRQVTNLTFGRVVLTHANPCGDRQQHWEAKHSKLPLPKEAQA